MLQRFNMRGTQVTEFVFLRRKVRYKEVDYLDAFGLIILLLRSSKKYSYYHGSLTQLFKVLLFSLGPTVVSILGQFFRHGQNVSRQADVAKISWSGRVAVWRVHLERNSKVEKRKTESGFLERTKEKEEGKYLVFV